MNHTLLPFTDQVPGVEGRWVSLGAASGEFTMCCTSPSLEQARAGPTSGTISGSRSKGLSCPLL